MSMPASTPSACRTWVAMPEKRASPKEVLGKRKTENPHVRFYTGAKDFYKCARSLDPGLPRLVLTLHAIELALKAYLLTAGYSLDQLRKGPFGHNLANLLRTSCDKGLTRYVSLPVISEDQIVFLTEAHNSRILLYEYTGLIGFWHDFSEPIASALIQNHIPWRDRIDLSKLK